MIFGAPSSISVIRKRDCTHITDEYIRPQSSSTVWYSSIPIFIDFGCSSLYFENEYTLPRLSSIALWLRVHNSDTSKLNDIYIEKQYHVMGLTVVVAGGVVVQGSTTIVY